MRTMHIRSAIHGVRPMVGRDPHAGHRAATPLELLFDLVFVVAFGVAGAEFAHLLAEGHYLAGLIGFGFAMFAVPLAWINFTWFASAYDTDDWVYRLTTMVQMMGVVVLALGLPTVFESLDASLSAGPAHGDPLDPDVVVIGYVIMRVPMVSQWLRVARQDPRRRRSAYTYAMTIVATQCSWVGWTFLDVPAIWAAAIATPLMAAELLGPYFGERAIGTPWHPHHVAERYGLLTIITLGEVVIGAVASLAAVIEVAGWTLDVALLLVGGVGLMFGMWWIYFLLPSGETLHRQRRKAFAWGYGHFAVYAPIVAAGAGLHVAALYIEHEAHITATAVMLTIAVPVSIYVVVLAWLASVVVGTDRRALAALAVKLSVIAASVALAATGVRLAVCTVVIALAPAISVVAWELRLVGRLEGPRADLSSAKLVDRAAPDGTAEGTG